MKNTIVLWVVSLSLAVWLGCVSEKQSSKSSNSGRGEPQQVFGPENISFGKGVHTISNAQKFILPIPSTAGEPLVYPQGTKAKGATGDLESISGQPILDWQGKPIGKEGIVFFNAKDRSWQAVVSDGQGVVIMNQVTEEQSQKLTARIHELANGPKELKLKQIKDLLKYAQDELSITDMYNSDKEFIRSKMNALESTDSGIEAFGLHRRDDRDICQAVFVEGKGEFQGPAATAQKFEDGAVIVKQGDSTRLIQPEIFAQTYSHLDGKPMDIGSIPKVLPGKYQSWEVSIKEQVASIQ